MCWYFPDALETKLQEKEWEAERKALFKCMTSEFYFEYEEVYKQ